MSGGRLWLWSESDKVELTIVPLQFPTQCQVLRFYRIVTVCAWHQSLIHFNAFRNRSLAVLRLITHRPCSERPQ